MLYIALILCVVIIMLSFTFKQKIAEIEYISFAEFVPHIINLFTSSFALLIIHSEGMIVMSSTTPPSSDPYTGLTALFIAVFIFVGANFVMTVFNTVTQITMSNLEKAANEVDSD